MAATQAAATEVTYVDLAGRLAGGKVVGKKRHKCIKVKQLLSATM